MNWARVLEHHADRFPERPCLFWNGTTITYGELFTQVQQTAAGLHALDIGRGDIVAHLLYNCPQFLESMFAVNYVGAIFLPLNWRLAGEEIAYILQHAGAKMLVTEPELIPAVEAVKPKLGVEHFVSVGAANGWREFSELRMPGDPPPIEAVAGDDVHRLIYTSGTTARPKGVMITYANLYWKNMAHVVEFGVTPDDKGLVCGPLYHVGALDLTTTTMLYAGASVEIQRRFDPVAVLAALERRRITNVWLAPAMVNQLMNHPQITERDLTSVRFIIDGGEKMPLPLIKRVLECFPNTWFADAYGLTETVSGDTFLDRAKTLDKIGSVGKPCLHLQVAIVDDNDQPLPSGQTGEIVLQGPKVFKGYWKDPDATATAFRNGWFHTGDVGYIDSDGFLFITDRKKDMIISGGENIASPEVERVLYEHSAVLEVAVVGCPDERWREVPAAFVVLREGSSATEDELRQFCLERLAKYKVPRYVFFIDALPRNPSGKVLKRVLRDEVRERVGLAPS